MKNASFGWITSIFFVAALGLGSLVARQNEPAIETASTQDDASTTPKKQDEIKTGEGKTDETAAKPIEDITQLVREYNSDKYKAPPNTFRKGHVTPRKLDAKAINKTKAGFQIDLPSKAPVPTVTFYQGRIYASGGFHSKEFYCFDANNGRLVWGINLDDDGPSAAVCEDGICVFNTESCTLFAVDASTGEQKWSWWLGDPLMSTPTIANGMVFTAYPGSGRFAGDGGGAKSPMQQNQSPLGDPNSPQAENQPQQTTPNAAPDQTNNKPNATPNDDRKEDKQGVGKKGAALSAPPQSHVLAAFDLKTGKILWQVWIDSDVMTAPVAVKDELYVTSFAGTVYHLKQSDGSIISAKKMRATSAPTIVGDDVIVTRRADGAKAEVASETMLRMDRGLAKQAYSTSPKRAEYLDKRVQGGSDFSKQGAELDAGNGFGGGAPQQANPSPAFSNIGQSNVSTLQAFQGTRNQHYQGRNYSCPGDAFVCNDHTTGKELWSLKLEGDLKKAGGFLASPPIEAGGQLFVATLKGDVLQVDPKSGKLVKKHVFGEPIRSQPIVNAGKIYVGTQTGKIVCLDTGDEKLTGWPMWGGNAQRNLVR